MRYLIGIYSIMFFVLIGTFCEAEQQDPVAEPIAAEVNGERILMSELDRDMKMAMAANPGLAPEANKEAYTKMKNEILDYLINQELMFQEGKKAELLANDKEIEAETMKVKQNFRSQAEFEQALKQQGLTENKYQDLVKRVMTMRKVIDAKVRPLAKPVTDAEISSFYESHKQNFVDKEKVKASHILIKASSNASAQEKAEAKEKIESILKEISQDGSNFADLAKKYSQCPSASQGGDLGFFNRGDMVKPFEDSAFSMQIGQVSGIVETNFGYHIIRVVDKKQNRQLALDEVSGQIKEALSDEALNVALADWLKPLREKASIKVNVPQPGDAN